MKNKLIRIILMAFVIVSFGTIAFARDITIDEIFSNAQNGNNSVGATLNIKFTDLVNRNDLYCVQRNSTLTSSKGNMYLVRNYLQIVGDYSTNGTTTIFSTTNGRLAYILNKYKQGYTNDPVKYSFSDTQRALYGTLVPWYNNVGKYYDINCNYADNTTASIQNSVSNAIMAEGENYGINVGNAQIEANTPIQVKDNTNKNEIKTTQGYTDGSSSYVRVGPFNWEFNGTIDKLYAYDENGAEISTAIFSKLNGTEERFYNNSTGYPGFKSGEPFYVNIRTDAGVAKLSNIKGTLKKGSATDIITAQIWYLEAHGSAEQNLILVNTGSINNPGVIESEFTGNYDIPITKNLTIVKVDSKDNNIRLANFGFKIQHKETNKYVRKLNGQITYVDNINDATTFRTNSNGEINLNNLVMGTYLAYETSVPNYQYKKIDGSVEIAPTITRKVVPNEQEYVKISGYVWKDIQSSKATVRNDLYKTSSSTYTDDKDTAFNGIIVRLKDNSGKVVEQTTTSEKGLYSEIQGGEYQFTKAEIDQLANYYIEFEYDGLIYQSVVVNLNNNNGSKATDRIERAILDANFASVNATGENRVDVKDSSSNAKYSVTYNETSEHATSIKDSSACILHANTKDAGYNIASQYAPGVSEIRYINLGMYERPQVDLALTQDLQSVNVGVNGYWHIYNYGSRSYQGQEYNQNDQNTWNLGVKFKNSYTGTYRRAIYQSDLDYEKADDRNKELQVYLTYKIGLVNESSYYARVNSIVDYFDNKYTIAAVGTGLDAQNNVTGNISYSNPENYNNNYKKINLNVNSSIESGKTNYIYVQFKLERAAILQIMNNKETLSNRAEITSYTTFASQGGNTIAALDRDSVPGNTKLENIDTYEDDTDSAPSVQLELTDARKLQGTVFVDGTTGELKTGEIRQGNGLFDNGEATVEGVTVTLHEVNNANPDIVVNTDANGNYEFTGYIPGQYTITYTWGDKTYTVQNYKGTVYDSSRNQRDMNWYKNDVNTRKTDAIDDYQTRLAIDKEMVAITDNTINNQIADAYNGGNNQNGITITKMNSTTPTMEFGVEYETTITDGNIDKVEFIVKNVDFGIVERARQQLDINKRVSAFKIVLANGQTIADVTVDENGKLQGNHNYVTYMAPSTSNGILNRGFIKAELDDEILEGSTLDVVYEIKYTNNSEIDYMSENYYKYGIKEGNIVTLTPSGLVDYLDKNYAFEQDKNTDWKQITVEELEAKKATKVGDTEFLNSRILLYTESTATALEPTKTVSTKLTTSKVLTTSQDLIFNNDVETVTITKPAVPGNQHRGSAVKDFPVDNAEQVLITPSTGEDRNYVLPVTIGIIALVIFAAGVVVIKRYIIKK